MNFNQGGNNPSNSGSSINNNNNNNNNANNVNHNNDLNNNTNNNGLIGTGFNNINNNNFLDFDLNDCDLFCNGNNGNLDNNNFLFDNQNNNNFNSHANQYLYFAPRKYEYLGQKEEQIYQDSKNIMNIPDFDFGTSFFQGNSGLGLTAVNSLGGFSGNMFNGNPLESQNRNQNGNFNFNGLNNTNNTNNLLFSTFNNNNAVDITDLFPEPEKPSIKQEHKFFMDSEFSPALQPISINTNNLHLNANHNLRSPSSSPSSPRSDIHNKQENLFGLNNSFNAQQRFDQTNFSAFPNNEFQSASNKPSTNNQVFQVVPNIHKEKKKDYDKNICRYITRQVVRSFSSAEFKSKVLGIISDIYPETPTHNILAFYKDVTDFFLGEIENLSGFRALKDILVINTDLDGTILATQKKIFKEFIKWYLKERYFRSILTGNMNDKLAFIRYKNKIMLHYINKPHKWNSNKKKKFPSQKLSSPSLSKLES